MAEYTNDLRLKEIGTGESSGTWGTETNTNLELIAEAFSYGTEASFGSDADATTTIADGATDPARSLYLKITSGVSLTATRTLTISPNTVSKVWIIENATSGSQSINISQGSGANVAIPSGDVKVIYTDGAGSGAAVVDAFTDLNTSGTLTATNLAGTLATAAQPNITSLGTLTALTGGTGDLNWDSGTLFVDSSANAVGIGTTSPAYKIDSRVSTSASIVAGLNLDASGNSNGDGSAINFSRADNVLSSVAKISAVKAEVSNNETDLVFSNYAAGSLTEKMRIVGATGNLIMTAGGTIRAGGANDLILDAGESGTPDIYLQSGGATKVKIEGSNGNVGIGTTNPGTALSFDEGTDTILGLNFNASDGNGGSLQIRAGAGRGSGNTGGNLNLCAGTGTSAADVGNILFGRSSGDNTTIAPDAEWMRIDSSGNVGIGTTSPSTKGHFYSNTSMNQLSVDGAGAIETGINFKSGGTTYGQIYFNNVSPYDMSVLQQYSTGSLIFGTNDTEAMRINSLGRLLIGGTADRGGNLQIGGTSSTARVTPQTDNVGYVGEAAFRWQAIYAVNGSIQTSDEREKTEIKETTLGLDFIKDLKPVSYKWIDGEQQNKGKDEREHQGLIAQQVAETVEKHGIDKNTFGGLDIQKTEKYNDFHGMSYDQFVAPLIKAIQEQQTIIDDLKSRIEALEG